MEIKTEMLKTTARMQSSRNKNITKSKSRVFLAVLIVFLFIIISSNGTPKVISAPEGLGLPEGFIISTIATGLSIPVDMEFLPSGDILVAEKGKGPDQKSFSSIKLVRNGVVQPSPVITLSTNTAIDSGLLAIAIDPDFATNHYFYAWYATGDQTSGWTGESSLRLSRFIFNPQTGKANPDKEQIILEERPWAKIHHGNSLLFDKAGNLFIGMGERGDHSGPQDLSTLKGKVIRIRLTPSGYVIPADNPYIGKIGARPEIYAIGFRNPYRMADREADGLIVLGDVGDSNWEEVNLLQPHLNYGYPEREGPCPLARPLPCPPAPPEFTDPVITYPHDGSLGLGRSGAVTAMDFYDGTAFPAEYQQKLFFADFNQGFLAVGDVSLGEFEVFAEEAKSLVDLEYYNQGLYILDLWPGSIRLITYTGSDNQIPTAVMEATPLLGPAPLEISFSGEGSRDPDGLLLKYHWDFGDGGKPAVSDSREVSHTYAKDGTYQASLKVVDVDGGESATVYEKITVYSGEIPKLKLKNLTESGRALYHGGDEIEYIARRSNLEGLDPQKPYTWEIHQHHNEHAHPILVDVPGSSGILPISTDNHGGAWNVWYRFYLTMHADTGQEITISEEIFPALVDLRLDIKPGSAIVVLNDALFETPYDFRSIVGVEHKLEVPVTRLFSNDIWAFARWQSNSALVSEEAVVQILAPAVPTTYTAAYIYDRPAYLSWIPAVGK